MDRNRIVFALRGAVAILIATWMFSAHVEAKERKAKQQTIDATEMIKAFKKNQPSKKTQASAKTARQAKVTREKNTPFADSFVEEADYYDFGEDTYECGDLSCGHEVGCSRRKASARVYGGFEATFVQPRYEQNVAFSTMESNSGGTFESITDTEFDYGLEFSPRVWFGLDFSDGLGWRVTWWEFDHDPANISTSPPANGFGEIRNPSFGQVDFGDVDISSTVPSDIYSAASGLEAYTIDLETIKRTSFCSWDLAVGGGVRYAHVAQSYTSQLSNSDGLALGQIAYRQSIEGIGPTVSLAAYRSLSASTGFFCNARGSILFGDGESRLSAGEDLDQTVPINTTITTSRDDLLSIGDLQVGFRWQSSNGRLHRPFLSIALEGQIWNGAGSATSEEGSLGFFGFTSGFGLDW